MVKLSHRTRDMIIDLIGLGIILAFICYSIFYLVVSSKIDDRIANEAKHLCAKQNQLAFKVNNGYICGTGVINPRTQ